MDENIGYFHQAGPSWMSCGKLVVALLWMWWMILKHNSPKGMLYLEKNAKNKICFSFVTWGQATV